ncbi:hypothetical protein BRADI_5g24412v3 [Brachypodium distachyon]|uniref:Uncharacterized protein n=1 Tax=Brachypodium distachyon TaxID=15368 RepID=A0A0Q3IFP2_BRADI|nr:hypothetical protein BRADI_5g24412v3 [Brachypodium distachyon]
MVTAALQAPCSASQERFARAPMIEAEKLCRGSNEQEKKQTEGKKEGHERAARVDQLAAREQPCTGARPIGNALWYTNSVVCTTTLHAKRNVAYGQINTSQLNPILGHVRMKHRTARPRVQLLITSPVACARRGRIN